MTELLYRFSAIRADDVSDDGCINLIASTDASVNFGGYREILVHSPEAVDTSAAKSLLLNHDRNQIIGGIQSLRLEGGKLMARVQVAESARTLSGTLVRDLVKSGALQGVSIGYAYDRSKASYDKESNTVTARAWELREVTLTPTQADKGAHVVRALPDEFTQNDSIKGVVESAAPAAQEKERSMPEPIKPEPQAETAEIPVNVDTRELDAAKARAADIVRITKLAESHGLRASDFLDDKKFPTVDVAIDAMIAKRAESEKDEVQPIVRVGKEQSEKVRDAAIDGLLSLAGSVTKDDKDLGERGFSILDIAKRYAERNGERNVGSWTKLDTAAYILNKDVPGATRGAANVTSSNFNAVVLGNYMSKAVFNGFNNFAHTVTYPIWTRKRIVPDFKTFASGALDNGNYVQTAEDVAFPELTKAEGSYTAALDMWGATIALTFQALVNDDLGEFNNMLNRAGAIAQRTIDKQVYAQLNNGTWTNNTTSGVTSLATAGALDKVRRDFETKTGPAGQIIGNMAKYLLVPSAIRNAALQATRQILPDGLQAYPQSVIVNTDIMPVITPHLTQAGTAANSTFYLAADPALADTVVVAFLQGVESPMVTEYDAGAVAARKWKLMMPFKAVLASTTVNSTVFIPGMQQGTT